LLRELLDGEDYALLADVVENLKGRAGRLRIRWTTDDITAALRVVGSNRELLRGTR
jgi:hypothetical protein